MEKVKQKMTAADIMTRNVRTIAADGRLADALAIMDAEGFSQLPVMRGKQAVGLLTERDVRKAYMEGRQERPVAELASPLPELLHADSRISQVLQALQHDESVLVTAEPGELEGIITYWDALLLGRPGLLVKEVELVLRRVVSATYRKKYGEDWWDNVPKDLRERAEMEHKQDEDEMDESTSEHMLGHTSLWALIEIFKRARPDLKEERFAELHWIRQMRNKVAHYYQLSEEEQQELLKRSLAAGDWLESLLPPSEKL